MTADTIVVWPGLLVACCSWAATMLAAMAPAGAGGGDATIIDQWSEVKPPDPPEVTRQKVDPKTTALLILDIERRTTNTQRRPRAVASVPRIARLLTRARQAGVFVAYSTTGGAKRSDILPEVRPADGEPVVASSVDKFYKTDLEKHLVEKGIKTVIVVGTAAEGAVLHTATAAAMRSFEVIVPVDGLSSSTLYAEQYVCWHLVNAPGSRRRTTLTKIDLIEFAEPTQP